VWACRGQGSRASNANDDNLVIVENDHALAEAFAVYIAAVSTSSWPLASFSSFLSVAFMHPLLMLVLS